MNTIPFIISLSPSLAPHLFTFDCSNAINFINDFGALCQTYPLLKNTIDSELKSLLNEKAQKTFEEMKQHFISHPSSSPIVIAGLRKKGFKVMEHEGKTLYIPLYLLAKMHAQQNISTDDFIKFSKQVNKHQKECEEQGKKREEQRKQQISDVAIKLAFCCTQLQLREVQRKYELLKRVWESNDSVQARLQDKYDDLLKEYKLIVQEVEHTEKENSELKAKLNEHLLSAATDSNPHSSQGGVESVEKEKFL
ncbi:hypothetical protein [Candidatus Protochlamydia phocaeensis]|uniref:hypothetical protein n=1 Tax=Candidatus Protochlamydia phocaeensis TaxID=1414722 RepID=UPI0008397F83|nr:hypothetical protein [Candidatus Protochlamydia phocaeensis]